MLQSLTCYAQHLANTETTTNSDASVLNLLRTTSRNHRNNRQLWCFSVLSLWPQCTLDRLLAFYKNRGMTVNGKTGCVASKSRAVIRHSLAASCSFCSSNTTPNKCLKESTTYLRTSKRASKPNLQIAILHAPLATSTKNEWKAAFGPSDTRNLIACILTSYHMKLTQLEQDRPSIDLARTPWPLVITLLHLTWLQLNATSHTLRPVVNRSPLGKNQFSNWKK